ncbi:MAG: hypothetical protein ACRDA8_02955 [Shewanella sp.]
MSNRGGARDGAGRPKGEETVMVRVPKGCLDSVRSLISSYKNQTELPAASSPWQPLSLLPEPGTRIDLWIVTDGVGLCYYNHGSDHYITDSRRNAFWLSKATAWRYSETVLAPDF